MVADSQIPSLYTLRSTHRPTGNKHSREECRGKVPEDLAKESLVNSTTIDQTARAGVGGYSETIDLSYDG